MPQLPSGRHVAISHRLDADPGDAARQAELRRIETVEDLAAYIQVDLFREATRFDGHRLAARPPLSPQSMQPPAELVPYDSGYTLAELDALTAGWSEEDAAAMRDFVASERCRSHLRDVLHQLHLVTGRVQPRLADLVMYNPEFRKLYEDADD